MRRSAAPGQSPVEKNLPIAPILTLTTRDSWLLNSIFRQPCGYAACCAEGLCPSGYLTSNIKGASRREKRQLSLKLNVTTGAQASLPAMSAKRERDIYNTWAVDRRYLHGSISSGEKVHESTRNTTKMQAVQPSLEHRSFTAGSIWLIFVPRFLRLPDTLTSNIKRASRREKRQLLLKVNVTTGAQASLPAMSAKRERDIYNTWAMNRRYLHGSISFGEEVHKSTRNTTKKIQIKQR
jgi:hypothetical protein